MAELPRDNQRSSDDPEQEEGNRSLPAPILSNDEFLSWRSPRFGESNPTDHSNPLWEWLIRTRLDAYHANELFHGPSSCDAGPMWCFQRFGRTSTRLQGGQLVHIGGEHEDYYDPDFYIYNDVVVEHEDGSIVLFDYPRSDFPPTDFHTATLLDGRLLLVGNLGYPDDRRAATTQVLELDLKTLQVREMTGTGECPGWICRHSAKLDAAGRIVVTGGQVLTRDERNPWENVDDWVLDPATLEWTRGTNRNWPQWFLRRKDARGMHLWQLRQLAWFESVGWHKERADWLAKLEAEQGFVPDPGLLEALYVPVPAAQALRASDHQYGKFCALVDGIEVSFDESGNFGVGILIMGSMPAARQDEVIRSLQRTLQSIEGMEIEAIRRAD